MNMKKTILMLGLLAMVLISSEVSARDLSETSSATNKEVVEQTNEYGNGGYGTYNPGNGSSSGAYSGHGGDSLAFNHCHYGCCAPGGGFAANKCNRCCSYAGEAVDVESKDNTRN